MTDRWQPLGAYLADERALITSVRTFAGTLARFDGMVGGLDVARWRDDKAVAAGRHAVHTLLSGYARVVPGKSYYADRRLFISGTQHASAARSAIDAVWILTLVATGGERERLDVDTALRLAFGGDPASQTFRAVLSGKPWPTASHAGDGSEYVPPYAELPSDLQLSASALSNIPCYGGLQQALGDVTVAGTSSGRPSPYPAMTITGLSPTHACIGDTVHVAGTGFGQAPPGDAVVMFGSTRASIVPGSWTPTGFDVTVPVGVSDCCVSILRLAPTTSTAPSLASSLTGLAGVLADCFGAAGSAAAGRVADLAGAAPTGPAATCAPDGSNRFMGGPPGIPVFRTDTGSASPQTVVSGQGIMLQWSVTNAASVSLSITPDPANSPYAYPPSLPASFAPSATGSITIPAATGLVPWTIDVTLTATNPCGPISRTLKIQFTPGLGLAFVGGGMRSSFHLGAIQSLGLILPNPPLVCSGTGLGALSAVSAAADYPVPTTLRAFWDASVDHDAWYVVNSALSIPGGDFAALNNVRWQSEARAEVLSLDALSLLRAYLVPIQAKDPRLTSQIFAAAASKAADKIVDLIDDGITEALKAMGAGILSYVPVLEILYAIGEYFVTLYLDSLKQQTLDTLNKIPAVFDNSRLMALIATATSGIEARIAKSGSLVRVPLTSLELGRPRYGTEFAAISDPPVPGNVVAGLTTIAPIVQASATLPLLGPPVKLGTDNYVDGSLRDPVPIGATIEAGATTVIVIQPNVRLINFQLPFDTSPVARIDARASLARDAQFLDAAVEPFGRFGPDATGAPVGQWRSPVIVVEPTLDLLGLGASFGQIGLVNIMSDYGWMRTYDTIMPWLLFPDDTDAVQGASRASLQAELSASTDTIIGLRVASWEAEHRLNGMRATPVGATNVIQGGPLVAVPDDSEMPTIRSLKTQIHDALALRLIIPPPGVTPLPLPKPDAESWYLNWEAYDFFPSVQPTTVTPSQPDGNPWVSLTYSGVWTVPAATPPANLWP